jgi:carboxymethylenebutenolidase
LLIGHATDDALIPADQIARLHTALDTAGVAYEGETYPAAHGWCVPGGRAYDEAAAERAWTRMVTLFKANLETT